jgi:8-oxo-dGTP diphosphatase
VSGSSSAREEPSRRIYLRTLCCIRAGETADGDTVLLLRRHKPPNQGLYNFPGGKIEPHEDPYEACLREVYEETGIRIDRPVLRAVLTVMTRTTHAQWLMFAFVAVRPAESPDPIQTDEGALRWVPVAEIPVLPVVSDIPLMLPHLLSPTTGVLMGKILADTDDADSILAHEFRIS